MSDQVAISNLIYEYARLIDLGDFAGIGDLFQRGKIIFKDSEQITWAHMDIAGTYWGAKTNTMVKNGATGVHVRTMHKLITDQ